MNSQVKIEDSWKRLLIEEFDKPYFKEMAEFIRNEYKNKTIYPKGKDIFNAFNSTPVDKVKAVIMGQDPYHGPNQAHGLGFSVLDGVKVPPSLRNIYKEISQDIGISIPKTGFLQSWASQGVLLLNNVLTVEQGRANSHKDCGWEIFTAQAIKELSQKREGVVFLLWGNNAQKKEELIDSRKHLILKAPHPSPLSAFSGFFGCRHFSKTNTYLESKGRNAIDWSI